MLDSVITYNGNSSEDVGLKVERYPAIIKADRKHEKVSVPGRNGDIYFFQDAWNNYIQPYEVFAGDRAPAAAQAAWENIISWLCQQDDAVTINDFKNLTLHGYHQLIDSYEPDVIRLAAFASGVAAENSWNRFGRATIDFDCRPERFTADAFDWVDLSEGYETYSGSIVSFEGSGAPMAGLKVDINPVQNLNGYSHPWAGGGGKNKDTQVLSSIKSANTSGSWNGNTYTVNGGTITILLNGDNIIGYRLNGTFTANTTFLVNNYDLALTVNSYIFGCGNNSDDVWGTSGYYGFISNVNGQSAWINSTSTKTNRTINITDASKLLRVALYISANTTLSNVEFKPMIRLASVTDATYEPYSNICTISGWDSVDIHVSPTTDADDGNTTTVDLGQTVYGGSLNVKSGVLTIDWGYTEYDGSSDEAWKYEIATAGPNFYIVVPTAAKNRVNGICNQFLPSEAITSQKDRFFISGGGNLNVTCGETLGITTVADWKTYLSNNPLQVVYELATSTTVQLTPTQVQTLLGQNNVWADSGDVEVKIFPTLNNPTDRNAKPFLKVTGSGNGTVVLNGYVINITGMTDYLYIDCESQNCFRLLAENKNNLITLTNGFPELKPGENAVGWTGGVTNVEIVPRWWRL